jgi:hypothetical protein
MDKRQRKKSHCSSCGATGEHLHLDGDGYTCCCGKTVCDGLTSTCLELGVGWDVFGCEGKPEKQVKACCWAVAEQYFDEKGITREPDEIWCLID